ncbi:MAG TPA: helix-turn-helix domain-containing protein, partial [Pyrinomonadaceae bacterium]|nr:helix-turn-helix domain-containing protein [Pyrinomonadaceae bacterium]
AREARGISISEVAEQTRISALYLEAIENNDYRTLPGGIFNKGFVKSFAKFVGVDENEALQDYSRLLAEQGTDSEEDPKTYRPQVLTDDHSRSSMIPTLIFAFIILALLTGGILWGLSYFQNSQNFTVGNNNNTNQAASNAVNTDTNVNTNAAPAPATDEINVEFRTSVMVSLTYAADNRRVYKNVPPNEPLTVKAQQSVRLSYFKGFSDKVQLTVNGRQVTLPAPPAKRSVVEFEITKDNIAQILQSGAIPAAAP